jgi:hypothetical protein
MTIDTNPTHREEATLAAVHHALERMGVTLGPQGGELSSLAAAVYRHGGKYDIDAVAGSFRAEIRPEQSGADAPIGTGFGWTPAVALAFALVDALADDDGDARVR